MAARAFDGAAPVLLRRSRRLLSSASRLLGVRLELIAPNPCGAAAGGRAEGCDRCRAADPRRAQSCQAEIERRLGAGAPAAGPVEWECAGGTRLAVYPVPDRRGPGGAIVCFEARPRAAAPPGGGRIVPFPGRTASRRSRRRRSFLRDLARLFADQLDLCREMREVTGELSTRYDELHMLYSIAGRLGGQSDLAASLRQMLGQARQAVHADAAVIVLNDRKLLEAVVRPGLLAPGNGTVRAWRFLSRELEAALRDSGRHYWIGCPEASIPGEPALPGRVHGLAVEVLRQGVRTGFLALLRLGEEPTFRSSEIKLLEALAEQAAMAASNADLYEDLRDFLMATVKSLVNAIEAKDDYTRGHSERVNLLAMLLGRQLGLCGEEMETLRWASILHDVGKIGMPERILCKPGRLTPDEFEVIKLHPERGYRLLSPIRPLAEAALCILCHHERMDGGGYPNGIEGTEIPRLARIISVADTYDAVTSTRSYRSARTIDFALEEMRRVRGTQLDPEMVDAFLELAPFLREHQVMIRSASEASQEEAA